MSDDNSTFIREVNEDLRSDYMKALWKRFRFVDHRRGRSASSPSRQACVAGSTGKRPPRPNPAMSSWQRWKGP
jgi:hypothetical protein